MIVGGKNFVKFFTSRKVTSGFCLHTTEGHIWILPTHYRRSHLDSAYTLQKVTFGFCLIPSIQKLDMSVQEFAQLPLRDTFRQVAKRHRYKKVIEDSVKFSQWLPSTLQGLPTASKGRLRPVKFKGLSRVFPGSF